MSNVYKINIDDKKIYLADSVSEFNIFSVKASKALMVRYKSNKQIIKLIQKSNNYNVDTFIIYHHNFEELKTNFFSLFIKITAAGGLVVNELGQILFIFRQGKWDLPKGKVEGGELLDMAAIREVEEETGISVQRIDKPHQITYHTYKNANGTVLKENHWYLMSAQKDQVFKPQNEEGITHVEWIAIDNLSKVYDNSFQSIKDVIKKYIKRLKPIDPDVKTEQ